MRLPVKELVYILIVFLLVGCATSKVVVGEKRRAISSNAVKVYLAPPPCNVEHIALLEASSRNSFAVGDQGKMNKAIARLKDEAAKLGANGILLGGTGSETTGALVSGSTPGYAIALGHKTASAVAIYVPAGCGEGAK